MNASFRSAAVDQPWWVEHRTGTVEVGFRGLLDGPSGQASAAAVAGLLDRGPVALRIQVGNMTGYLPEARQAWTTALWPRRKSISSMTLVGGNALVKMGGAALGLALGIPVVFEAG
jgi:hypothetical protein